MSKRKYHIQKMTQEQLTALGEKFPSTVEVIHTRRPVYSIIAKMLDCGLQEMIPEVVVITEEEALNNAAEEAKKGILSVDEAEEVELKGAAEAEAKPEAEKHRRGFRARL